MPKPALVFFHSLLPLDVTLTVLQEWLDVSLPVLSKLDMAICNHSMRSEWMQLLCRVKIEKDDTRRPIRCYLGWLSDRRVYVNSIDVDLNHMQELKSTAAGRFQLPTPNLEFDRNKFSARSTGLKQFLSFFPRLDKLNFQNCPLTDRHLYKLLRLPIAETVPRRD